MASGEYPYPGAAACSSWFPFDTAIRLTGNDGTELVVVCKDRGHLESKHWIDVYCPDRECGRYIAQTFSPFSYGVVEKEIGE